MTEKTEEGGHGVSACPQSNVPHKDIYCAHRGHGCISQNGYLCSHGPKCEPMDENGRRFAVFEWIEDGQPLATRRYLDYGELAPRQKRPVAPIIDSDEANAALVMVKQLMGRAA